MENNSMQILVETILRIKEMEGSSNFHLYVRDRLRTTKRSSNIFLGNKMVDKTTPTVSVKISLRPSEVFELKRLIHRSQGNITKA